LEKAAAALEKLAAVRFPVQDALADRARCWRCARAAPAKAAEDPWEPIDRAEALAVTAARVWRYSDSPGRGATVGSVIAQAADESPPRWLKADAEA
jgi:hypothetical protein